MGPKVDVLARLERDGNTVRGRHFYAHLGVDLPLAGSVTDTGDIALSARGEGRSGARQPAAVPGSAPG
ncbi:hypothetical protein WMF26_48675 [Sorangium sp. So ce185]|uniref:hypothetical protein n=1 Tax=Sorangium sp. So ce185 TaxID=3133287 RepID=UPI003F621AA3